MSWIFGTSKTHLVVVQTGSVDSTLAAYHLQKVSTWDQAEYIQYNPQDPDTEYNLTHASVPKNGVVLCLGCNPPESALRYFLNSTPHVTVVSHKKPLQQPVIGVQYYYDPNKTSLIHVVETFVIPFMEAQVKAKLEAETKAAKEAEEKAVKEAVAVAQKTVKELEKAKNAATTLEPKVELKTDAIPPPVPSRTSVILPLPPVPEGSALTSVPTGTTVIANAGVKLEEKKEVPKPFHQALGYLAESRTYPWWYECVNHMERGIYQEDGKVALQLVTQLRRIIQDQPFGASLPAVYALLQKSFEEFSDSMTMDSNVEHQDREKCIDKIELSMWKLPKEVCSVATIWPVLTCDFTSPLEIQRMALLGFDKFPSARLMIGRIPPSASDVRAPRSVYFYLVKAPSPTMSQTDAPVVMEDLMKALGNATGEPIICRPLPLAGEVPKLL